MRGLLSSAVIAWLMLTSPALATRMIPIACAPDLPRYCANIHIGCSGRSRIETAPFLLELNSHIGLWTQGDRRVKGSARRQETTVVFRPEESRDWIRVQLGNGSGPYPYAERIYKGGQGLMARGRCWHSRSDRYRRIRERALEAR